MSESPRGISKEPLHYILLFCFVLFFFFIEHRLYKDPFKIRHFCLDMHWGCCQHSKGVLEQHSPRWGGQCHRSDFQAKGAIYYVRLGTNFLCCCKHILFLNGHFLTSKCGKFVPSSLPYGRQDCDAQEP